MREWTPHDTERMDASLEGYRAKWEAGDTSGLGEAVALCGWNHYPLPEWCVQPVLAGLELLDNKHGSRGRAQSPALRLVEKQKHRSRYEWVAYLMRPDTGGGATTLEEACDRVAERLGGNVTSRAVKASYYKVKRTPK
jgi:hypothetical protein